MKCNPIDIAEIANLLEYAPELGGSCLRWKVNRYSGKNKIQVKAGQMAGTRRIDGYWGLIVDYKHLRAHRIVWALCTGNDATHQIDHIDRDPGNNRIENLREATPGENQQNTSKKKNNKSGYTGVSWHKEAKRWRAEITIKRVKRHLGCYDTPQEAADAYCRAKAELHTFHPKVNQ